MALLISAMGQNPNIHENPEVFNPDRFLPENRANKNQFEYIPFSAGPRNCIGKPSIDICILFYIIKTFLLNRSKVCNKRNASRAGKTVETFRSAAIGRTIRTQIDSRVSNFIRKRSSCYAKTSTRCSPLLDAGA